jgi:hypothetical protein
MCISESMCSKPWVLPVEFYALYMLPVTDVYGVSSLTYVKICDHLHMLIYICPSDCIFVCGWFPKYAAACVCGFEGFFVFVFLNNSVIM